jgi:integrase/recombinase XerD
MSIVRKGKKPIKTLTYSGKGNKFKLRGRILNGGQSTGNQKETISLYIEAYFGSYLTPEGKRKHNRSIEFLNLHIVKYPQTKEEREKNNEVLQLAEKIRAKREEAFNNLAEGFTVPSKKKINFVDYYQSFLNNYKNRDIRLVKYSLKHFEGYIRQIKGNEPPPDKTTGNGSKTAKETKPKRIFILPSEITEDFVKGFVSYLQEHLNGETPYNYFTKFKRVCKEATKEGIFPTNPAEDIIIRRPGGVKKEILSFKEIQSLAGAYCGNEEIKQAFLFCLNTGLRFVDVKGLKWKHIDFENRVLKKLQTKIKHTAVNPYVYIDLNNNALSILKHREKGKPNDLIFTLPTLTGSLKTVKKWAARAGIEKNITWHSARHSFATNLLMSNTDIKTVSELLGHSGLKHTEKYTHLVSKLKRKAVDSLPEIEL